MKTTEAIRIALQLSYDWNRTLAESMRDAPMTFPTQQGGNHPTWVVGHAAWSSSGLMSMITGEPSPLDHLEPLVGGGSEPTDDATLYPDYDDMLSIWEQGHHRRLQILTRFNDAQLDAAPAAVPEQLKGVPDFQTIGRIFLFVALHEMSHRGQLADARRTLNRPVIV